MSRAKAEIADIAETLEPASTPVREALAAPGVRPWCLVQVDYRSVCVAVMDLGRFDEVRDLRLVLEGKGAERAACCATPADIAELQSIHAQLVDARRRDCYPDILAGEPAFHLSLCRAARMPCCCGWWRPFGSSAVRLCMA